MALAPFGHCAGTAAALLGLFQMSGSGALVGFIGVLMHDPLSQLALHMWLLLPPADADDPPGPALVFAINPVL